MCLIDSNSMYWERCVDHWQLCDNAEAEETNVTSMATANCRCFRHVFGHMLMCVHYLASRTFVQKLSQLFSCCFSQNV